MGSPSLLTRVDDTNISTTHSEGTIIGVREREKEHLRLGGKKKRPLMLLS